MKRVTHDPLTAVESMLDSCRDDEVNYIFTNSTSGKSLCVYPIRDDAFAAAHAVQISHADRALVQAGCHLTHPRPQPPLGP